MDDITIGLAGPDRLDELRELWLAMHHHHQQVTVLQPLVVDLLEADTRRRLVSVSAASRQALEAGNTKRLVQLIDEFDEILFDSLQNRRIRALIGNLRDHVKRIGHLSEQTPGRLSASAVEHERIIQAITDGDPVAGARTMREHILSVQAQQLALSDPA